MTTPQGLLNVNLRSRPSKVERVWVISEIQKLNEQMKVLSSGQIGALQDERDRLASYISPFRCLPAEMIQEIGGWCIAAGTSHSTLTQICGTIREDIIGASHLWTRIQLGYPDWEPPVLDENPASGAPKAAPFNKKLCFHRLDLQLNPGLYREALQNTLTHTRSRAKIDTFLRLLAAHLEGEYQEETSGMSDDWKTPPNPPADLLPSPDDPPGEPDEWLSSSEIQPEGVKCYDLAYLNVVLGRGGSTLPLDLHLVQCWIPLMLQAVVTSGKPIRSLTFHVQPHRMDMVRIFRLNTKDLQSVHLKNFNNSYAAALTLRFLRTTVANKDLSVSVGGQGLGLEEVYKRGFFWKAKRIKLEGQLGTALLPKFSFPSATTLSIRGNKELICAFKFDRISSLRLSGQNPGQQITNIQDLPIHLCSLRLENFNLPPNTRTLMLPKLQVMQLTNVHFTVPLHTLFFVPSLGQLHIDNSPRHQSHSNFISDSVLSIPFLSHASNIHTLSIRSISVTCDIAKNLKTAKKLKSITLDMESKLVPLFFQELLGERESSITMVRLCCRPLEVSIKEDIEPFADCVEFYIL